MKGISPTMPMNAPVANTAYSAESEHRFHLFVNSRASPQSIIAVFRNMITMADETKKSLEVYQHLSLESVEHAYQHAVQSVWV